MGRAQVKVQRLSVEEIRDFVHRVAREMTVRKDVVEPIPDFHIRYAGVLESCLSSPFQSFGGSDLYADLPHKGAALFYLLIKNHPFANGNKRIAVVTLRYFFLKNGYGLGLGHNNDVYQLSKEVAESDSTAMSQVIEDMASKIESAMVSADLWLRTTMEQA
jgi:death-on-curing family protein